MFLAEFTNRCSRQTNIIAELLVLVTLRSAAFEVDADDLAFARQRDDRLRKRADVAEFQTLFHSHWALACRPFPRSNHVLATYTPYVYIVY
jgi:hypothetical protein